MASALINVPATAKRGDIIEIKTLMSHIMETGFRHTVTGEVIPRNIITNFTCRYNGDEVFRADLFPAFSANPFISFFTIATTFWVSARRMRVDTWARPDCGLR